MLYGSPALWNITFSAFIAAYGGGMFNSGGHPSLTNILFSANDATYFRGGMYNYGDSPIMTNITFTRNVSHQDGGGIFNQNGNPIVSLLLAPFLAFFFLRDGRRFVNRLIRVVPNAFFERTLDLVDQVDTMAKSYFQGLLYLTFADTACLDIGLAVLGIPTPWGSH